MATNGIELEINGRVATLTILREQRRNSLDNPALEQMLKHLDEVRRSGVSVLIVSGEGVKAFCAGSDLKALAAYSEEDARRHTQLFQDVMERVDELPCATIAAIEGFCLGGGLELALCCDYRIASSESFFGFPEITVGALPTGGGTVRAPRAIGFTRAREMLVFGGRLAADKALNWGLISEIVNAGSTRESALAMARPYAEKVDPISVALLKHILVGGYGTSTRAGHTLAYLADFALVQRESFKAGVSDFSAKKKAD
ncbi:MAG: enoyl-CoA hydratase/isomerase family protein [Alphaproteobacteria bacterium]